MKIVILSGAGLSAESGIKTFRGQNGLWNNYPVEQVSTNDGFTKNPILVHSFYNNMRKQLNNAKPNLAHYALANLEKTTKHEIVHITQNIDNLCEQAECKNIIHIHGELNKVRCLMCSEIIKWNNDTTIKTVCPICGFTSEWGGLRPHIVWFNENPLHLNDIDKALAKCDLFVAIGTSGNVYPAAAFVKQVKCNTILLNKELAKNQSLFDNVITGKATEIVPKWVNSLLENK